MLENYNGYRVLEVFLKHPTKMFGWREISAQLKLAPVSVKKYIDMLLKEKIIIIKEVKRHRYYAANRESKNFSLQKIFYNLNDIRKSGLVEYLNDKLDYPAIILFGSTAKGEDIEESDIDIAVFCTKKKEINLEQFEKAAKRRIQLIIIENMQVEALKEKNKELLNSIINGIVIEGFLEVI